MKRTAIRLAVFAPVAMALAVSSASLAGPTDLRAEIVVAVPADSALSGVSLVPSRAIDPAASVSPARKVRAASDARFVSIVSRPEAGDIPAVALAAYQRAESLIGSADDRCHLSWQLLAAIGRVESDHGRFDGSALDEDGRTSPAIIGPALNGKRRTTLIRDTDAGLLDGDVDFDHAVGPMQFIPSTWAVVGVDADSDGARDPQDIDDAALGAAVYLCSGEEDLDTPLGLRAAIQRYNHSAAYIDQVVSVMKGYLAGNEVPTSVEISVSAGFTVRLVPLEDQSKEQRKGGRHGGREPGASPAPQVPGASLTAGPRGGGSDEPASSGNAQPHEPATPAPPLDPTPPVEPGPTDEPTSTPTEAPTEGPTEGPTAPTNGPTDEPTGPTGPTGGPTDAPTGPTDEPTTGPIEPSEEAIAACTLEGLVDDPKNSEDDFDICVAAYDEHVIVSGQSTGKAPSNAPGKHDPVAIEPGLMPVRLHP